MGVDNKEVEHESIYLGADAVHPEDMEADVILPGEPGYEAPEETGESAGEDGAGEEAVSPDPEVGAGEEAKEEADQEKEAEAEGAEPEQEEEPEVAPVKNQMIPKARLDKELRARRALEARVKELEQGQQTTPTQQQEPTTQEQQATQAVDLDTAELEKAFLEGDMTSFGKSLQSLLSSRDTQMREVIRAELQKEVPGQLQQNQQRQSFEAVRDELETQYEFLDPNSEHFDTTLVDTISNFTSSYVNQGYTPGEALQEAADKVLRIERPDLFKAEPVAPEKQEQVRKERMNIDKKLQAAKNQPPVVQSGDADSVDPLPDFESMSEAEFDKLTDEQLNQYLAKSRASR